MQWTRETPWRQGSVISTPDACSLGLLERGEEGVAVVVSHDCDIASENLGEEPDVEVIVGRRIPKADGQFKLAKHPRRLHVVFRDAGTAAVVELSASTKRPIPKPRLVPFRPDEALILPADGKEILQCWLAKRYKRQAFPDELSERLRAIDLARIVKHANDAIVAIFVDYDPDTDSLASDQPYEFWIYLVYEPDAAGANLKLASEAADAVKKAFAAKLSSRSRAVELRACEPVPDVEFSMSDMRNTVEYNFEHLSLREGDSTASSAIEPTRFGAP